MSKCHVLVAVVDGLRASALGAYGNTTFATPALDAFAAESALFDCCFAPAADLPDIYRSLMTGRHAIHGNHGGASAPLPPIFAQAGYKTTCLSDDTSLAALEFMRTFQNAAQVTDEATNKYDELPFLARSMAAATELVNVANQAADPQFVWMHFKAMYGPWDAPQELQQSLLDEGDGAPVMTMESPDLVLHNKHDADLAFRYGCAYAAQVMLFDTCWSELLRALEPSETVHWLVVLLGARGFPLGEHGRVGGVDERMYVEQLHVPWLVRLPEYRYRLARTGKLVSHIDLAPTLMGWLHQQSPAKRMESETIGLKDACSPVVGGNAINLLDSVRTDWRDTLISTSNVATSLRTADWSLRMSCDVNASDGDSRAELFVRPDDRWEANDVAARCPETVNELCQQVAGLTR